MSLRIRNLYREDIPTIAAAFHALGWDKPALQYEAYFEEQERGERPVLVAFWEEEFVGYLTVMWQSHYLSFREAGIPEIVDFNVLPPFRGKGIGNSLMERAEEIVAERTACIGIGVGMTADYGAAQRIYVRRGYLPDGRGLTYDNRFLKHGERVCVDDSLVLHFTKDLKLSATISPKGAEAEI